ncbi:MAG: recombination protein RecR [Succinivibrio sp.]|nr:recombination protein RecR [Succinivibrio sp.]
MSSSSALVEKLISALQIMPGIGPVSAARIAYYLLDRKRQEGVAMSETVKYALEHVSLCPRCRNYTDVENTECELCSGTKRRQSGLLCIVETPGDVQALENSGSFLGTYFVLHGHLSPIDGIGPQELGFPLLQHCFEDPVLKEVIIAVGQTVEGEATAQFIAAMAHKRNLKVSRIATGIPIGGELSSTDGHTLENSINFRRPY